MVEGVDERMNTREGTSFFCVFIIEVLEKHEKYFKNQENNIEGT